MRHLIGLVAAAILVFAGMACARTTGYGLITFLLLAGVAIGVAYSDEAV